MARYIIKDNFDEFVKYSNSSSSFIQEIKQCVNEATMINFWIIPQCAVSAKQSRVLGLHEILNDNYSDIFDGLGKVTNDKQKVVQKYFTQQLKHDDDKDNDDDGHLKFEQELLDLNSAIVNNENIVDCKEIVDSNYCIPPYLTDLITDHKDHKFVTKPIWDLQSHAKKIGFTENSNYWYQEAKDDMNELRDQFHEMFKRANTNCNGYQHYLFVIDRRNPQNLKDKNMHFVKRNYIKTSTDWADVIYLFVGDMIYNDREQKPILDDKRESMIYSSSNLFPDNDSIKINDELNGYKFILSYNFSTYGVSNTKWFIDGASNELELSDMRDRWNQCFVKLK